MTLSSDLLATALGISDLVFVAGSQVKLALYTDSSGEPGSLVVATAAATQTVGNFQITIPSTYLAAGTYWIAAIGETEVAVSADASDNTHQVYYYAANFADDALDPWPVGSDEDMGINPAYLFHIELIVAE